jgi:hypothetical protein
MHQKEYPHLSKGEKMKGKNKAADIPLICMWTLSGCHTVM